MIAQGFTFGWKMMTGKFELGSVIWLTARSFWGRLDVDAYFVCRQQVGERMSRVLVIAVLMVSFIVGGDVVFAGPLEDGQAAFDRGDHETALRVWRPLAEQGNAEAQLHLGVIYMWNSDWREAVKWWRLAAKQGLVKAQSNLGFSYAKGKGIPQDFLRGHMWSNIAAAGGDTDAIKIRDELATMITKEQIAEAQAMARKCEASNYKQCD